MYVMSVGFNLDQIGSDRIELETDRIGSDEWLMATLWTD